MPEPVSGITAIQKLVPSLTCAAAFTLLCFIANCFKWKYRNDTNFFTSVTAFVSLLLFQIGRYELELLWPYWAAALLLVLIIGLSYVAKPKKQTKTIPLHKIADQNIIQINIINNNPTETNNK